MKSEYFVERYRIKRSLFKWRIFAFILAAALVFMFFGNNKIQKDHYSLKEKKYVASILIEEVIFEDLKFVRWLDKIANDKEIKAVIININSPGGTVVGSEMLYNALRRISEKKPTVALLWSMATSGGYMAALGADHIIAHEGTITGSVGVLLQTFEATKLAENIGIVFHNFKSGDLKASPNPMEPVTQEAKKVVMDMIGSTKDFFVNLVKSRRKISDDNWEIIKTGRIFSSIEAKKIGLIDAVGSEQSALLWLKDNKKIAEDLEIEDIKMPSKHDILDVLFDELSGFSRTFPFFKSQLMLK